MNEVYMNHEQSVRKILGEIIGVSPAMVRLRRAIRKIARSDENVLISGETGVGKQFLSQKIHSLSRKNSGPFVEIDCGLMQNLLSNGKQVGFTEFIQKSLQKAGGGTLVLHRIEELSHEQQMQLLWCLHEHDSLKNGKRNARDFPRIIATSALDTKSTVEKRCVDAKLFYYLGKVILTVPPLRNRKQDIPYLFEHFLQRMQQNGNGNTFSGMSDELYDSLMSYEWQGNVEELQNSARSLLVTTENNDMIPEALPFLKDADPFKSLVGKSLPEAISKVEKYLMKVALGKYEGNQTKAARYLKISEASLRYKLKKYKISNK